MRLDQKKCVPCQAGAPSLTRMEAKKMLQKVRGWKLILTDSLRIQKESRFKDFARAVSFINKVAKIAEKEGHHPDIFVSWNRVILTLYTHKINGLHENDFILAAKIDRIGGNKK